MNTASKGNLSFEQLLSMVKQLPRNQKLLLSQELEKEAIDSKLTQLLKSFKAEDLDLGTLDQEIESVRQEMLKSGKVKVIFDTNVWISFLIGKRLSRLKSYISSGHILIVTSE